MDAYVSKPIDPQELFSLIEGMTTDRDRDGETGEHESSLVMNKESALARALGDEDSLRELVELFVEDTPTFVDDIRNAITVADSGGLRR